MAIEPNMGDFEPNDGEALTIEDVIEMLRKSIKPKARIFSYLTVGGRDVIGVSIGQSDQAEKHDLHVQLTLGPEK
jgi:hypothetical protein